MSTLNFILKKGFIKFVDEHPFYYFILEMDILS